MFRSSLAVSRRLKSSSEVMVMFRGGGSRGTGEQRVEGVDVGEEEGGGGEEEEGGGTDGWEEGGTRPGEREASLGIGIVVMARHLVVVEGTSEVNKM